jgi:hypothetical protein
MVATRMQLQQRVIVWQKPSHTLPDCLSGTALRRLISSREHLGFPGGQAFGIFVRLFCGYLGTRRNETR